MSSSSRDFAISDDGSLNFTQVKHSNAVLTLRSKAVAALISAAWTFQLANPSRSVLAALVTTGKIGKEKRLRFPGAASGLSYWRVAARDQADIEPMRKALLGPDLPADLKTFLKHGTSDDIRRQILRPIRWFGSGQSQDEIQHEIHEQLVYFGSALGVGAQNSKNALNALIVELMTCMRRKPELQFVTLADLRTVFEKNTYRLFPPSALESVASSPTASSDLADTALATRDAVSIPCHHALLIDVNLSKTCTAHSSKTALYGCMAAAASERQPWRCFWPPERDVDFRRPTGLGAARVAPCPRPPRCDFRRERSTRLHFGRSPRRCRQCDDSCD